MFRKFVIGVLVAVVGLYAVSHTKIGRRVSSIACTAVKQVGDKLEDQIPIEDELARLKDEVARLDPDYAKLRRQAAQEQVTVEGLSEDVSALEASLQKQKNEIDRLRTELKANATTIVYNGREASRSEVTDQLTGLLDTLETTQLNLETKKEQKITREAIRDAKLDDLRAVGKAKDEMTRQIAKAEAELARIRLQQTQAQTPSQFDNSRLADIKDSLNKVRTRIKVEQADLNLSKEVSRPTTSAKTTNTADVLRRADQLVPEGGKTARVKFDDNK